MSAKKKVELERFASNCNHCGKSPAPFKCSRCLNTFYCCKECQTIDWKDHKLGCAILAAGGSGKFGSLAKKVLKSDYSSNNEQLLFASGSGRLQIVLSLIKQGVNVDFIHLYGGFGLPSGVFPLYLASMGGYAEVVSALIAAQADVDLCKPSDGTTSLMIASGKGHLKIVRILLSAKASVHKTKTDGSSALYIGSQEGFGEVVKALIESGASVHQTSKGGWTALMVASSEGHFNTVKILIAAGAIATQERDDGCTALYAASGAGHVDIIKALIAAGANVNKTWMYGDTPLYYASGKGKVGAVIALLDLGANAEHKRLDGATALSVARQNGFALVVNVLERHLKKLKERRTSVQS